MIYGPAGVGKSALVASVLAEMGQQRRACLLIEGGRPLLPQVAGWLFAQGAKGDPAQANPQEEIWGPMVAALERVEGWLILDHADQVPDVTPPGVIQPKSELGTLLRALALGATKGGILLLCEEPLDLHLLGLPDHSVAPVPIAPLTLGEALILMAQMPHLSQGLSLAQIGSLFAQGVQTPRQILRLASLARARGADALPPDVANEESVLEILYDALPPVQQTLLRRLSVYHHPLPRSFMEAQWVDTQDDLPSSLQALISASLLDVLHVDLTNHSTEPCYVLSNKIRDWAERKLREAEGEPGWMAANHRGATRFESCANWIQHDPSVISELLRLLLHAQEYRKLAEFALGAADQLMTLGLPAAAGPLAEMAVQSFKKDGNKDRYHGLLRALLLLSRLKEQAGDAETARLSLQDATAEAQAADDQEGTALILNALGSLDMGQGRYQEARRSYEEAMAIAQRRGDDQALAGTLNNLARVAQLQGRRKDAASLYAQSSEIYGRLGDQAGTAVTMLNQATMERTQGNYPRALELAQRSLEIYRRLEQPSRIALGLLNLAVTYSHAGDLPAARGLFDQSLALFRTQEDLPRLAECLMSFAELEYRCENYESAKALLDEAQPLAERLRARRIQASILFLRARLGLEHSHAEAAIAHLQDAVILLREIGEQDLLATSLYILGVQASEQAQPAVARAFLEEALALRRQEGHPRGLLQVMEPLADLLAEEGDLVYARSLYTEAVALCKQMGDPAATARCLHSLGSLAQQTGQTDAALAAFAESEQLCRQLEDKALLAENLTAMGSLAHERGALQQARALAEEAVRLGSEADDDDPELNARLLLVDVLEDAGQGAEIAPHLPRIFALQRRLGLIEVEEYDGGHGTGVEAEDDGAALLALPGQIADSAPPRFDPRVFTVRELLTLMENDELRLDEDLPRLDRWDGHARSLLIESLLLGVPLPPLYLSAEYDGKLTVLDGHQRLSCLRGFLSPSGRKPGGFALGGLGVLASDNGKRFGELDPLKQRRLQQAQIPAHVLDSQTAPEIRRDVLRRLGTGAAPLRVQEIIHLTSGPRARDFLRRCAESPTFEEATCGDLRGHPHLAGQEVVLRFCAFRLLGPVEAAQDRDLCVPQLMLQTIDKMDRAHLSDRDLDRLAADLERALGNARDLFGEHAFRRWPLGDDEHHPLNRALFESWAVALAEHDPAALVPRKSGIIHRARLRMLSDRRYVRSISGELETADQVRYRFAVAAEILRGET